MAAKRERMPCLFSDKPDVGRPLVGRAKPWRTRSAVLGVLILPPWGACFPPVVHASGAMDINNSKSFCTGSRYRTSTVPAPGTELAPYRLPVRCLFFRLLHSHLIRQFLDFFETLRLCFVGNLSSIRVIYLLRYFISTHFTFKSPSFFV